MAYSSIYSDPRSCPTEEFISDIRKNYRVEKEVDHVLTRKLINRAKTETQFEPISLDKLIDATKKFIASKIGSDFKLSDACWLSGGASMLQMAFNLHWNNPVDVSGHGMTRMVLRMSPMEPVVETSFIRESEIINVVKTNHLMPVANCYWTDEAGDFLPYPAIIYGFVDGVAKPSAAPSQQVTGIGINFGPQLRGILAEKAIEQIASLHKFDASKKIIPGFDFIESGSNEAVIKDVNWWHRVWEEDRGEEEPLIQAAANWLKAHAPPIDHVSIIHNDLRSGNFLFDENTAEITAWLDWELVSLGDRHQDLGWLLAYQFGHFSEDGETFLASGLLPTDVFLSEYEKATGMPVDENRLKYYSVLTTWKAAIIVLGTGYRVAKGGKTHQDVVVSWLSGIGYLVLDNLRNALKEAMK